MRVLYVVTAFARSADDIITPWLTETITRLAAVGVEVEVLAPSYRGLGTQVVHGVRVHRFRYAPAAWETLSHDQTVPDRLRDRPWFFGLVPAYLASGCIAAASLARTGRFDAVHAFWPIPHAVLGLAARRAGGLPLISTFFGVELTWLRARLPLLRPVLAHLVRNSDGVTAISSYTAGLLRALVPSAEPVLIPFGAAADGSEVRPIGGAPLPRPADAGFRVLFVGRLVERKGVHVLIEAVRLLNLDRPVRLEIVGDGPLRSRLERQARETGLGPLIRFRGSVSAEELSRAYDECDVFVLPAVVDEKGDTEGLGVVLIEALLHGTPVVASAAGGIPDIVRHDETGLLVPPGSAPALADALRRYRDDPALAANHAAAGQAHVRDVFSWDAIVARLVELYERVAEPADTPPSTRGSRVPSRQELDDTPGADP